MRKSSRRPLRFGLRGGFAFRLLLRQRLLNQHGGDLRARSAERLRDAVVKALREIHAVLNPDQRVRLAYLIRTGTLSV